MSDPTDYEHFAEAAAAAGATRSAELAGFDPDWRSGREKPLAAAIVRRALSFTPTPDPFEVGHWIDIGAGASELPVALATECEAAGLTYVAVDSPQVLSHIASALPGTATTTPGRFPEMLDQLLELEPPRFVSAYSVAQYLRRPDGLETFLIATMRLLESGGVALIGDLPNGCLKRRRMAPNKRSEEEWNGLHFTDDEILGMLKVARRDGFNSYLLPGLAANPLTPHREDVVIVS